LKYIKLDPTSWTTNGLLRSINQKIRSDPL
jgi:hypothetical protein